jgi:hypothetical protein
MVPGILLTLLLLGLVRLVNRRLARSPARILAYASKNWTRRWPPDPEAVNDLELLLSKTYKPKKPEPPPIEEGSLLLSLFVEDQNTAIGRRNVHLLKDGYSLTVGGGRSDFLIFLVPLPPVIAEIRYEGGKCRFIPRKAQYFPDLGEKELPDCVGETIRLISDKQYELRIRFEIYEDPLSSLNRLLGSVMVPGL